MRLCLCLRQPGFHDEISALMFELVLVLASLVQTRLKMRRASGKNSWSFDTSNEQEFFPYMNNVDCCLLTFDQRAANLPSYLPLSIFSLLSQSVVGVANNLLDEKVIDSWQDSPQV